MTSRLATVGVLVGMTALGASSASAALLGTYAFTSQSLAATDNAPTDGVTFDNLSIGSGLGSLSDNSAPAGALRWSGNDGTATTVSGALTNSEVLSFKINIASGVSLDLSSIQLDYTGTNTFSHGGEFFSSVKGTNAATGTIGTYAFTTTTGTHTLNLDSPTSNAGNDGSDPASNYNLTGPTTITFYLALFDGSTSSTRFVDLNELRINGTATPEPAMLSLLGLGGLLLTRRRR